MDEIYLKLGEMIRLEREKRGLTQSTMAEQLKTSETSLEGIETGNADSFASFLYFNLSAKSYAEALGINYQRTIDLLREEPPIPAKAEPTASSPEDDELEDSEPVDTEVSVTASLMKKVGWAFGIVIGLLLIVVIVFKFVLNDESPMTADSGGVEGSHVAVQSNEISDTERAKYENFSWGTPSSSEADPLKLVLLPREESWATVYADGEEKIYKKLYPGRRYEVEAKYRLRVSVSIPRVVDVTLNGRSVNLADPQSRRISRVFIDQMNLESFFLSPSEETEPAAKPSASPQPPAIVPESADSTDQITDDTSTADLSSYLSPATTTIHILETM